MTPVSDLITDILVELPGCPSIVAEQGMRRALRDWYRETWTWRETLAPITLAPGTDEYPVEPPEGSFILALAALPPVSGERRYRWAFSAEGGIKLLVPPAEPVDVVPHAVLMPTRAAGQVPESHAQRWADDWLNGALWNLRLQRGKPWYSPEDAEYHRSLFHASILAARIAVDAEYRSGDLRVQPQPFK